MLIRLTCFAYLIWTILFGWSQPALSKVLQAKEEVSGLSRATVQNGLMRPELGRQREIVAVLQDLYRRERYSEILRLMAGCAPERVPLEATRIWIRAAQFREQIGLVLALEKYIIKDKRWQQSNALDLAALLIKTNLYPDACLLLNQLDPPVSLTDSFFALKAEALTRMHCRLDAQDCVRRGLELHPRSPQLYYARSLIEKESMLWKDAAADLETAIRLDPTKRRFYELRIEMEQSDPARLHVVADFDKLIELSPKNEEKLAYLLQKAAYLNRICDTTGAVKVLTEIMALAPEDQRALRLMRIYCAELERNGINCPDCQKYAKRD
jgi:tetratricopeptide (TPR) repeat protein